ncbi:sigma-70 family RNA polymerase sigma factor [Aquabacter sp. CN5-332]|uniref:sigma-70 family RNA polymerase sigma factor n=1 Tax=Aquabacter sp. CN5-332 TaxID=3156608 RepID=UPI0032B5F161
MREASDEDLMAQVARGDERAFRTLAERFAGRASGLARRYLGNDTDAEEVVQEALLRVWTAAPRWRPEAAFGTWFYQIVVHLCLNRLRRAPHRPLEEADDPVDPAPDALARLQERDENRALEAAISALPERQRAVVLLTYWEGFSNARTAEILGASVSSVETLLVRARRSLREHLRRPRDEE